MERKYNFLDEITQIFIIYSSHIANPFVSIGVSFLAHGEGEGTVDVGEHYLVLGDLLMQLFFNDHYPAIYK